MILFDNPNAPGNVLENVNDVSQLLNANQILLRGKEADAVNAIRVLGTANATYKPVYWKRKEGQQSLYTDYIVTIG